MFTKVLFPHPLSPTSATDSLGLIVRLRPLRTKSSVLVGYLNQTFLNSILPLMPSTVIFFLEGSLLYSKALIYEGYSIILNTFVAAILALAISGPIDKAVPA